MTWLIHACDVMTWLIHACDVSRLRVTWLLHVCDMSQSYVWHDLFVCVAWLLHVWHDSFMCVTWLLRVWHDSFIRVTWLIHMCDMTHSYAWLDFPHPWSVHIPGWFISPTWIKVSFIGLFCKRDNKVISYSRKVVYVSCLLMHEPCHTVSASVTSHPRLVHDSFICDRTSSSLTWLILMW